MIGYKIGESFPVYTYGEMIIAPSMIYYVSWTPTTGLSGTFSMHGNTYNFSNYSGYYSSYRDYITSSAFFTTSLTSMKTNVTRIYDYAFYNCTQLSKISCPECSYIGSYAFAACRLSSVVNLPKCEYIGKEAFTNNQRVTRYSLPECITISGDTYGYSNPVFRDCISLTTFYAPKLKSVPAACFYNDIQVSWLCCPLTYVNLTNCERICDYAFCDCKKLKSISCPECSYIGSDAFEGCSALSIVSFPKCEYIGRYAFYATSISQVVFPECVYIGPYAFAMGSNIAASMVTTYDIHNVKYIGNGAFWLHKNFPNTLSLSQCNTVGHWAFAYCSGLKYINLPECTTLHSEAFGGALTDPMVDLSSRYNNACPLVSVNLPKVTSLNKNFKDTGEVRYLKYINIASVTRLDSNGGRFSGASLLSTVIATNCSYVGTDVFLSCTSLNTIDLRNCKSIGYSVFINCPSLTSIDLPECTYIGSHAFWCINLKSISLPKCEYISNSAFYNCIALEGIVLPICSYVGMGAFYGCSSLSEVYLPMCSYVGIGAFYGCSSLSEVYLPECSYIESQAFDMCQSLESISIPKCEYLGYRALAVCKRITDINLPVCSFIGLSAFRACDSLRTATLGYSGVCSCDGYAFYGTSILSIYVPSSLVSDYQADSMWSVYATLIHPINN